MGGWKLRNMSLCGRVGMLCLLAVFAIGMVTSAMHLYFKYQKRDDQPELTITDIKGAYHGVKAPPPLKKSLDRGHPETLEPAEREVLVKWLESGRIIEDYENIDLGDASPREIMSSCVSCHSRAKAEQYPEAAKWPLESLEDIKAVSFVKEVMPNDIKILTASTHAHALSLASMVVCLGFLLTMTTWKRCTIEMCWLMMGVGLLGDIGSWWLARQFEGAVYAIVISGAVFNFSVGLVLFALAVETIKPRLPQCAGGCQCKQGAADAKA